MDIEELQSVLQQLDELAELWGDEGKFRRCRDRLRQVVQSCRLQIADDNQCVRGAECHSMADDNGCVLQVVVNPGQMFLVVNDHMFFLQQGKSRVKRGKVRRLLEALKGNQCTG